MPAPARCDQGCKRPARVTCLNPDTMHTLDLCLVHTRTHEVALTLAGWTLLPEGSTPEVTTTL